MSIRAILLLLSLWLLMGPQGLDVHVRQHIHDDQAEHAHVVTAFDTDHSHARIDSNGEDHKHSVVARVSGSPIPLATSAPGELAIVWSGDASSAFGDSSILATGPPPHLRPPSQAPPPSFALV